MSKLKSPSEKAFLQWGEKAQQDLSKYEKTGKLPEGMFEFDDDDNNNNTEILKSFNDVYSSSIKLDIKKLNEDIIVVLKNIKIFKSKK